METLSDLGRMIDNQYKDRLAILYDRVLLHRKMTMDKSNTLWNINLNVPARRMKGSLMLFEDVAAQQPFARNTEAFYGPKITKVVVTIEGIPNQLYSRGMRAYQMWGEPKKYFAPGSKRHPEVGTAAKDLALADVNLVEFLTSKYSMWFDLRTSDDDRLYGSGRRIENASEGITILITKKPEAARALNIYFLSSWMRNSVLKMAYSTQRPINLLPQAAHSATICEQTGCGKTVFILDLLEGPYRVNFQHIVVLCQTVRHNKTYQPCPWIWTDPEVYLIDPGERLIDYLQASYNVLMGEPTLYIIDDCSALTALTKKKVILSILTFSGRHAEQFVWGLTQKYSSVLRENDVIPSREQRPFVRKQLAETKHA